MDPLPSRRVSRQVPAVLALLLVAGAPAAHAELVLGVTKLGFTNLPDSFVAGQCTSVDIGLLDSNWQPVSPSGDFTVGLTSLSKTTNEPLGGFYGASGCAGTPIVGVTIGTTQTGTKVWFLSEKSDWVKLTVTAEDPDDEDILTDSKERLISPAQAASFKLSFKETLPVQAGQSVTLTVQALDAFGNRALSYTGQVQFTSTDPLAILPTSTSFTLEDLGSKDFPLTFGKVGTWGVTVSDTAGLTGTFGSLQVIPGAYSKMMLSLAVAGPVAACSPAKLTLQAVDAYDNPVPQAVRVKVCAPSGSSAAVHSHTLLSATQAPPCIEGDLPANTGAAEVSWTSNTPQTVEFTATDSPMPVSVTWGAAGFSAAHSTLTFSGTTDEAPSLRTFTGKLGLYFEPKDSCGNPARLPAGQSLAFEVSSELLELTAPSELEDGRWKAYAQLKDCPADASATLSLWPTLNQEQVLDTSGTKLKRYVKPLCLPPDVQLAVRAEPEGLTAAPGQLVDFVLEVRNTGQETFDSGLLGFASEGMSELELSLDGQPLTAQADGYGLPPLPPGATLTVKGSARADVTPDSPVRAQVWYATGWGVKLTEKQLLSFEREALGVDVGAGCGAGPAAAPLPALLLLWAVASRSWRPSRRLRRGERARH